MHVVRCPHCQTRLKLNREARDVNLQCNKCGMTFVGSTQEEPDPPAAPKSAMPAAQDDLNLLAALQSGQRQSIPGSRVYGTTLQVRQASKLPIIIAVLLGLLVFPLIIAVYYYSTTVPVIYNGVDYGRMSPEKAAELQKLAKEKPLDASAADPANPAKPAARPVQTAVAEPVKPEPVEVPVPDIKGDINVMVLESVVQRSELGEDQGTIVGRVNNSLPRVIRKANIILLATDSEGKKFFGQSDTALTWIPPKTIVKYSVSYNFALPESAKIVGFSQPEFAPEGTICWPIDASENCRLESPDQSSTIVFSGRVVNTNAFSIEEVEIYVDFFTSDNVYVGTATGKLDQKNRLGAKQVGFFRVTYETKVDPKIVTNVVARAVGKKGF